MPVVCIIDDDEDVALLNSRLLALHGIETVIIVNSTLAMDHLEMHPPDVILLDIFMPNIGGEEILHQIRQSPTLSHIPVIVLTTGAHMLAQLKQQADEILIKPHYSNQLVSLLERYLSS